MLAYIVALVGGLEAIGAAARAPARAAHAQRARVTRVLCGARVRHCGTDMRYYNYLLFLYEQINI